MLGAGVFAALGPAAQVAGAGLLVGLALAAAVAYCNASSSAQLAAVYPESGGTYVYGRKRLDRSGATSPDGGSSSASSRAARPWALTFGSYAAPRLAQPLAAAAVVAVTVVNSSGVRKTAAVTRGIVIVVLAALAAVVVAALSGRPDPGNLQPLLRRGGSGCCRQRACCSSPSPLRAHRDAGRGGRRPAAHDPTGDPAALGITLAVYAAGVAAAALLAVGLSALAAALAPLAAGRQRPPECPAAGGARRRGGRPCSGCCR